MKPLVRTLIALIAILVLVSVGWFLGKQSTWFEEKSEVKATVLLERIRDVVKLVTVEGHLSELYAYEDYVSYDISPLRKKALVRVTAKVSAGYDFEKMQVAVKPKNKEIVIYNFPPAEILSIEHDLDYYDITEGVFNGFEAEDYNKINGAAKDQIRQAAEQSDLLKRAQAQKDHLVEMLAVLMQGSGYELKIAEAEGTMNSSNR